MQIQASYKVNMWIYTFYRKVPTQYPKHAGRPTYLINLSSFLIRLINLFLFLNSAVPKY